MPEPDVAVEEHGSYEWMREQAQTTGAPGMGEPGLQDPNGHPDEEQRWNSQRAEQVLGHMHRKDMRHAQQVHRSEERQDSKSQSGEKATDLGSRKWRLFTPPAGRVVFSR